MGQRREVLGLIHERGCALPYIDDPRPVTCVGVAFDETPRNLADRLVAEPSA